MQVIRSAPGILLVAAVLAGCSPAQEPANQTMVRTQRSAGEAQSRIMTFKPGFPPPASIGYGVFGLRNGCLVLRPEGLADWLVAVLPSGSSFTRDQNGLATGVTIEGRAAKFGERIRFGGGVAPYDLGAQGRPCPGPTVIVGNILK